MHIIARTTFIVLLFVFLFTGGIASAQTLEPGPDRRDDEGVGPFEKLIIKNCILIDGTGAPPRGPVNIFIKNNRIEKISSGRVPDDADHVLDAEGMFLLPGFIDMHAHCGSLQKAPAAEYCYKLWMGHGVTTVRGVQLNGNNEWVIKEKQRSADNEIVPRESSIISGRRAV